MALRRVRRISPEEAALWARVTATIAPLSREKAKPPAPEVPPDPPPVQRAPKTAVAKALVAPARPGVGTTLDGSWDRRISGGAVEPDSILDLHGMSLDRAWTAIDRALDHAINRGERVLLLITGHYRGGDSTAGRGKIRAAVNDWLAASRHAPRIASVRGAHGRHGGGGSLYIILRRR